MLEQSWKKIYSRKATKSVPLLQPEHGFFQQNGPEHDPNENDGSSRFVWMADVVIVQGAWVLCRISNC